MKTFARILTACLLMAGSVFAQQPAPKIICDKPDFDVGFAEPNSVVNHEYVIRNAGETTLELKNVRASCGCTIAKTSANLIKPGETATITASLNLAGRNGRQDKHVIVESNDPATPTLILTLRCTVREDYSFTPANLNPGSIRGDQPVEFSVLFTNTTPNPIRLTKANVLPGGLTAEVQAMTEGFCYRVHVKTVPPLAVGPFNAVIHVETDSVTRPGFDIPFNASVIGALTIVPDKLTVMGPSTNPVTRYIIVRAGTVQKFNVLGVEAPAEIKTTASAFGSIGTRITLDNIVPAADLNGKTVKITTDVPGMTEVLVPIAVVAQP